MPRLVCNDAVMDLPARQSEHYVDVPPGNWPLQVLAGLLDAWVEERPQFDWHARVVFTPAGEVLPLDPAAVPPFFNGTREGAVHRNVGLHRMDLELSRHLRAMGIDPSLFDG